VERDFVEIGGERGVEQKPGDGLLEIGARKIAEVFGVDGSATRPDICARRRRDRRVGIGNDGGVFDDHIFLVVGMGDVGAVAAEEGAGFAAPMQNEGKMGARNIERFGGGADAADAWFALLA
jgi:hypothetical protein